MSDHIEDAALIAALDAGRELERREIVAFLKLAVDEAEDKMFRARSSDVRRNFAAASIAIQHITDLIEDGEHRNDDHG